MSAVKAENLVKIYDGRVKALKGINLEVREGEIFGFLGPNGAGKTTTINILITLLKPTEGRAWVLGYDVVKQPEEVRKIIGIVPQELTADDELTGWENMMLQAKLNHVPRLEAEKRAKDLLDMVQLSEAASRLVRTYSGGMRRRLELAMGLIHRPCVLFMDEPTLGLDVQSRTAIWDYIRKLNREYDITIFLTTHYMEEADALCERLAIIDHGKIIVEGKPEELKEKLGGDIITLEVADIDKASKILSGLKFVSKITNLNGLLRVKCDHAETALPLMLKSLMENGVQIKSASMEKPSLGQVFLEYTGRRLRDEMEAPVDRRRNYAIMRRRMR